MFIRFNRKKEITVRTTRAPDEKIKVQAYPVQLHPNFPLKLAVYRDPCNPPTLDVLRVDNRHLSRYLHSSPEKQPSMQAIVETNNYIQDHLGDPNSVIEVIKKNEVLNETQ